MIYPKQIADPLNPSLDPLLTVQYVIFSDDAKHSSVSEAAAALYVNVSTPVLQEGITHCIHCVCACVRVCVCV